MKNPQIYTFFSPGLVWLEASFSFSERHILYSVLISSVVTTACCDLLKELNSSPLTPFKKAVFSYPPGKGSLCACPGAQLSFGPEIPHSYIKGERVRKIISLPSEQHCTY